MGVESGALNWKIEKTVKKGDCLYAVVRDHPKANKYGYVLHHRVIMENTLGRLLNPNEIVHHINGDKKDNRPENLELMTNAEHASYHGLGQGRWYVLLKCPQCKKEFEKPKNSSFLQKGTEYTCCSRACRGKFSRYVQLNGRTIQVQNAISENLLKEFRKTPRKP